MGLSHLDDAGKAKMVDVSQKTESERKAVACAAVLMKPATLRLAMEGKAAKGDVFQVARLAGIMAAKNTSSLIPLCHNVQVTSVTVDITPGRNEDRLEITATARALGRTGVEMEALTAASVCALTIYDMLKAAEKEMVVTGVALLEKSGGKSGDYTREKGRPE